MSSGDLARTRGTAAVLIVILAATDQTAKQFLMELLLSPGPRRIAVLPFFNLTPNWNYGISFGMFSAIPGGWSWVVVVLTVILTVTLAAWAYFANDRGTTICLASIVGGSCGNVIDRIRLGAVFDYLDFHVGGWHWPTFNFADIFIFIGTTGLLLITLEQGRDDK